MEEKLKKTVQFEVNYDGSWLWGWYAVPIVNGREKYSCADVGMTREGAIKNATRKLRRAQLKRKVEIVEREI